jgi:hypothetical protein
VACTMNEGSKDIPESHRHGLWHYYALIWENDSLNSKAAPLEAIVTIKDQYLTYIESTDGLKKTDKSHFKPAKIAWYSSNTDVETGTFKILDKTYIIQLTDLIRIRLPSDGDTDMKQDEKE